MPCNLPSDIFVANIVHAIYRACSETRVLTFGDIDIMGGRVTWAEVPLQEVEAAGHLQTFQSALIAWRKDAEYWKARFQKMSGKVSPYVAVHLTADSQSSCIWHSIVLKRNHSWFLTSALAAIYYSQSIHSVN